MAIQLEVQRCKFNCLVNVEEIQKLTTLRNRAAQITQAYNSCPNTKLVASGYSQGGQLVHNALGLLPADIASWVSKVVIFGDPGMFFHFFPSLYCE